MVNGEPLQIKDFERLTSESLDVFSRALRLRGLCRLFVFRLFVCSFVFSSNSRYVYDGTAAVAVPHRALKLCSGGNVPRLRCTPFFLNTTPQFGSLRPLPKTDLQKNKNKTATFGMKTSHGLGARREPKKNGVFPTILG